MKEVLAEKGCNENIELVEGDIINTVPRYVQENEHLRISLLNLDTDIYKPSKVILENLYPKIVNGGVLIMDDCGTFPGETKAIEEYFDNRNEKPKLKK